jgi:hypothetical protein
LQAEQAIQKEVNVVRTVRILVLITKVVILIGLGDATLVIEIPIIDSPKAAIWARNLINSASAL